MARNNIRRFGAVAVAVAGMLGVATANASPCTRQIAEFRGSLPHDGDGRPTFVGSTPQSIAAQLEHQPTRESVERAKKQSQTQLLTVLAQAETLDLEGRRRECLDAFARAKLMLNP
ncbi:MAG: hypothetical protein ABR970_17610 [Roseiarcus sp.]|jgi:hypothetical protein